MVPPGPFLRFSTVSFTWLTGDGSGYYTLGETLDYPSVSHINSVAQKNNFLIIFAVIEQYKEAYKALSERITGKVYSYSHVSVLKVWKTV